MLNKIVDYFNPKTPASDTVSNQVSFLNLVGSNLNKAYGSTFNYSTYIFLYHQVIELEIVQL